MYPNPVRTVNSIEMSGRCNLACTYCPNRTMPRPKVDMDESTFAASLDWVRHFWQRGTQGTLWLHGLGESTLHPQFIPLAEAARAAFPDLAIKLSTNGVPARPEVWGGTGFSEEIAHALARLKIPVHISLHVPQKAGRAVALCKELGILEYAGCNAASQGNNWAGQVDWPLMTGRSPCQWLRQGWCQILATGDVTTCCYDSTGAGVISHVSHPPEAAAVKPYGLCETCHEYP